MHILLYTLLTLHVMVCLLMVLVVLMQRPRSEGLGAAFGSGMTENIFGAQTTHVLAKFTTGLGIAFFVITLALAMVYARINTGNTTIAKELLALPQPTPVATPATTGETLPAQPTPAASPAAVEAAPSPAVEGTPAAATPAPANAAPNVLEEAPVPAESPAATPAATPVASPAN